MPFSNLIPIAIGTHISNLRFINFNGDILPEDTKLFSVHNRAFRFGDGVFESMRLMKGGLKFADLHADRLQKGMKALKIEGYSQMDTWFIKEKAEELARRNKIKNGYFRLTVYREAEGLYTPLQNKMAWCLEINPLDEARYFLNTKGLIVDIFSGLPKACNYLSNIKTCSSLVYVMAGIFKNQNRLDEVLLLNQNGFLCEAGSANLFIYYQDHLYTPALSEGCIEGVMRQVIVNIAEKINVPVTEAQINPEILNVADEVFLTSARFGIQSVMGFGIKRYFNNISKILLEELNKL